MPDNFLVVPASPTSHPEKWGSSIYISEDMLVLKYNLFHHFILAAMGPCKYPDQDNVIPLTGETGRLFSPRYPRNFAGSITCTWVITVPEGHFVRLRIKYLSLYSDCYRSALHIRDGQNSSSDLLKKYCHGEKFQTSMFSSGRYLRVQFMSQKYYGLYYESYFDAIFEAVKQGKTLW